MRDRFPDTTRVNRGLHTWLQWVLFTIPPLLALAILAVDVGRNQSGEEGFLFSFADDAMISMAYAQTLSSGGGLVWFPGADNVQGITSPGWVLVMALVHLLGFQGESAVIAIQAVASLMLAGAGFLSAQIFLRVVGFFSQNDDLRLDGIFAAATAFSAATIFPLAFWTLRGFETGLLALVSVGLVQIGISILRASRMSYGMAVGFIVVASIGLTVRLDFAVIVFAIGIVLLFKSRNQPRKLLVLAVGGLVIILFAGLVLLFQYLYYDSWLPNTYFLKVGESEIGERILRGLQTSVKALPLLAIFLASSGALIFGRRARAVTNDFGTLSLGIFLSAFSYSIVQGGDSWEEFGILNRFIAPVLPIFVISLFVIARIFFVRPRRVDGVLYLVGVFGAGMISIDLGRTTQQWGLVLLLASAGIVFSRFLGNKWRQHLAAVTYVISTCLFSALVGGGPALLSWLAGERFDVGASQSMVRKSIMAKEVTLPGAKIAVTWAGIPAYYSGRDLIDILGKNDAYIARLEPNPESPLGFWPGHTKWSVEYSIGELRPDIILNDWHFSAREEELISDFGFRRRCLPSGEEIRVQMASSSVDFERLTECN